MYSQCSLSVFCGLSSRTFEMGGSRIIKTLLIRYFRNCKRREALTGFIFSKGLNRNLHLHRELSSRMPHCCPRFVPESGNNRSKVDVTDISALVSIDLEIVYMYMTCTIDHSVSYLYWYTSLEYYHVFQTRLTAISVNKDANLCDLKCDRDKKIRRCNLLYIREQSIETYIGTHRL